MTRGLVVPLSPAEVVQRALFLAGEVTSAKLDRYLRASVPRCPTIYYRMEAGRNGGFDPTAPDPASRWQTDGGTWAVTCDCVGGAAWCAGFDRYQPVRFDHLYGGWCNTNSIIIDASGPARCFVALARPEIGSMVVCKSGSPGHAVGHVGTIVSVPAEWDATKRECWEAIGVVDVAGRKGRANMRTTARGWFGTGALFVRSRMIP